MGFFSGLRKKLSLATATTALALVAGCASTSKLDEATKDWPVQPIASTTFDLRFSKPASKVSNVPKSIRHVPIHKRDGYASRSNNGPIKDSSAKLPILMELGLLKAGVKKNLSEDVRLNAYADLSLNFNTILKMGFGGEINRRNYTNHPGTSQRGYGAALTYWTADYRPLFIPGFKADVEFSVDDSTNMIIGCGYRIYDIVVQTGWDRYDKFEVRRNHSVAELHERSIYLGLRTNEDKDSAFSGFWKFHLMFNKADIDRKYRGTRVSTHQPSWGVSFGVEYMF